MNEKREFPRQLATLHAHFSRRSDVIVLLPVRIRVNITRVFLLFILRGCTFTLFDRFFFYIRTHAHNTPGDLIYRSYQTHCKNLFSLSCLNFAKKYVSSVVLLFTFFVHTRCQYYKARNSMKFQTEKKLFSTIAVNYGQSKD